MQSKIFSYLFGSDTLEFFQKTRMNTQVFLKRNYNTKDSSIVKTMRLLFFVNFMLPSALFGLNPWFQRNCSTIMFMCMLCVSKSNIIAFFFVFWLTSWIDNMLLGVMYHNVTFFKRQFDALCLGADMVLAFHGNTGTVYNKMTPAVLKGIGGAIGAASGETIVTEGLAHASAKAATLADPSLKYATELSQARERISSIMPLHNWFKRN